MTTGGIKVELRDGHTFTLRYDTPQVIAVQQKTGRSLGELLAEMGKFDVELIVWLVWAGLIHAESALTFDTVAERVSLKRMDHIIEKIGEALVLAFPEAMAGQVNTEATNEGNPPTAE